MVPAFVARAWPIVVKYGPRVYTALPFVVAAVGAIASKDYESAIKDVGLALGFGVVQHNVTPTATSAAPAAAMYYMTSESRREPRRHLS